MFPDPPFTPIIFGSVIIITGAGFKTIVNKVQIVFQLLDMLKNLEIVQFIIITALGFYML